MQTDPSMPMSQSMDPEAVAAAGAALGVFILIYLAIFLVLAIGLWKMFNKAGQPGILAFIPIVNLFFIVQVAGKPAWWGILMLIPFVNFIVWILVCTGTAERFGRGIGTALGLFFLTPIFTCILGFGSARWTPAPA